MRNKQKCILKVALPVPLRRYFDYLPNREFYATNIKPGVRVQVPFGKTRMLIGMLISITDSSEIETKKLKPIYKIIDDEPLLLKQHIRLLQWASGYYHYPIGEVIFTTLSPLLRRGKPAKRKIEYLWKLSNIGRQIDHKELNRAPAQLKVLKLLHEHPLGLSQEGFKDNNWRSITTSLLNKGLVERFEITQATKPPVKSNPNLKLNPDQLSAINIINDHLGQYHRYLLDGVTGSGKTEVYLEVIKQVIRNGQQALLLVPEIGLTPQLISRIDNSIDSKLVVMHSSVAESKRLQGWLEARDGTASVILGTRSAIWAPLKTPGVIIIDEEHDLSYKQQDGFRYSARDVGVMRSKMMQLPIVLGSATPSLESLRNVNEGKFTTLKLKTRTGVATPPEVRIIDLRSQQMNGAISQALSHAIANELAKKRQILLFLNRRGYAPVILCHKCGWMADCKRCEIHMTYHKYYNKLICHHCESQTHVPKQCPECNKPELQQIGQGTQRVTESLANLFPMAKIIRIDRDSTRRKGAMEKMVASINAGNADILIGTQMLAKGHDFPNLTLVGILDADSGLFSTDFRTSERMSQLYVQVSGRAGRSKYKGTVYIQTHYPNHPLLLSLVNRGYSDIANILLEERQQANLPPFTYLALLRAEDFREDTTKSFLNDAKSLLIQQMGKLEIYGPIPAPIEKRSGRLRFQLLVQANNRNHLKRSLKPWSEKIENLASAKKVRWSLDVDPQDML